MMEFKTLAMKVETNNIHTIFLLKKNVRSDIIKTILEYLPIAVPKSLKEWKVVITLVKQEYKSIEGRKDYWMGSSITYRGREALIDIRKAKDNYGKDRKPRCFNYNIYGHIAKDCRKLKKKKETKKCHKCNKVEHLAKNCRLG